MRSTMCGLRIRCCWRTAAFRQSNLMRNSSGVSSRRRAMTPLRRRIASSSVSWPSRRSFRACASELLVSGSWRPARARSASARIACWIRSASSAVSSICFISRSNRPPWPAKAISSAGGTSVCGTFGTPHPERVGSARASTAAAGWRRMGTSGEGGSRGWFGRVPGREPSAAIACAAPAPSRRAIFRGRSDLRRYSAGERVALAPEVWRIWYGARGAPVPPTCVMGNSRGTPDLSQSDADPG